MAGIFTKQNMIIADEILDNYKKDLRDMVDKDYNHPSVIMYSAGNEVSEISTEKRNCPYKGAYRQAS